MKMAANEINEGAINWWASLTPGERAGHVEALWIAFGAPVVEKPAPKPPRRPPLAKLSQEAQDLCRASFAGKPYDFERMMQVREWLGAERFDAISKVVRDEERAKLNPFNILG